MLGESLKTAQRLPNCLIIGPQKAGTSWIHAYLQSRGDVVLPSGVKETFFFDRYFGRGADWYLRHFQPPEILVSRVVEAAPSYFHCSQAPQRIAQTLGRIPLICTLREPVARTYSLFLHHRRYGRGASTLRQAVRENPILVESSKYATQLRRWIDCFGQENISVLFLEELAHDPQAYAERLCQYLDLVCPAIDPTHFAPVNEASTPHSPALARIGRSTANALRYCGLYSGVEWAKQLGLKPLFFGRPNKSKLPMLSDEDRQWLADQLGNEVDELEKILGLDLTHWKRDFSAHAA